MRRETFIRTFLLTLALLSSLALFATHTLAQSAGAGVSGTVKDPQGAALRGATVTLYARGRTQVRLSTATDDAGAYRFERLAPGEYIVEAAAAGFARAVALPVTIARGAQTSLDFTLEVAGVSTEVVVTAADSPQTVDEVSKAVNVVGRGEMDERDEATVADL